MSRSLSVDIGADDERRGLDVAAGSLNSTAPTVRVELALPPKPKTVLTSTGAWSPKSILSGLARSGATLSRGGRTQGELAASDRAVTIVGADLDLHGFAAHRHAVHDLGFATDGQGHMLARAHEPPL